MTGIAGQDGSYLAELLIEKGYEVHGIVRRHSIQQYPNIQHLLDKEAIRLHMADVSDLGSIESVMEEVKPTEVYNLAAQSHVGASFTQPEYTLDVTGLGALRVFEAARRHSRNARIYQASSSEQFGNILIEVPAWRDHGRINEAAPFAPISPYGDAKVLAHHLAQTYRKAYNMHISCGILMNHESERRGTQFVTRKITRGLARIKLGLQSRLELGNLDAIRDWGHAKDYMVAAHAMLQRDRPDDWVVATGIGRSVNDFLFECAKELEMDNVPLASVPQEHRPSDIWKLVGDSSKARREFDWQPTVDFGQLVKLMTRHDLKLARLEAEQIGSA